MFTFLKFYAILQPAAKKEVLQMFFRLWQTKSFGRKVYLHVDLGKFLLVRRIVNGNH